MDQKCKAYKVTAKSVNSQVFSAYCDQPPSSSVSVPVVVTVVVVTVVVSRLLKRLCLVGRSQNHGSEYRHSKIRATIWAAQQVIPVNVEFVELDVRRAPCTCRHAVHPPTGAWDGGMFRTRRTADVLRYVTVPDR